MREFNPYKNPGQKQPWEALTMTGAPFTRREINNRLRNGPAIEIYRIPR